MGREGEYIKGLHCGTGKKMKNGHKAKGSIPDAGGSLIWVLEQMGGVHPSMMMDQT